MRDPKMIEAVEKAIETIERLRCAIRAAEKYTLDAREACIELNEVIADLKEAEKENAE